MSNDFPKTFAVWFKDFNRWDPVSFHGINWHWPRKVLAPIGSLMRMRKERVDRAKFPFSHLQPITIHFDGSIERRQVDSGREYSMDLFFAHPGDIVVAKIDLKNGAVGIVPDWHNVIVTGHFAVYEPDRANLLPEFLIRLIQTSFFKAYLWRNKVGAEGRKEVKLDFFESLKIPAPPIPTQWAILAEWQKVQDEIAAAEKRIKGIEAGIEAQFFADLGLKAPTQVKPPKCFAASWKDFLRWSVSSNQAAITGTDITKGKFPVVDLGSLLNLVQYGTSEKANKRGVGAPIIRMNNIVDGVLELSNLKHLELPEKDRVRLLLQDGDILFNRTNSKELVGKCAVFHESGEYIFASYLIRFRMDSRRAKADYVAFMLNSPIGRKQIDAMSRQIIGQANINSNELRSLQIPLPPLDAQQQIMDHINSGRARIARERETAKHISEAVEKDVEEMILGVRPINKTETAY